MMKIKRLLCIILAIAMIGFVVACAGDTDSGNGGNPGNSIDGGDNGSAGNTDNSGSDGNNGGGNGNNNNNSGADTGRNPDDGNNNGGSNGGSDIGLGNGGNSGNGDGENNNGGAGNGGGDSNSGGNSGNGGGDGNNGGSGNGGDNGSGNGNGGGGGSSSGLSGTAVEVISNLVDALKEAGVEMPMALPPSEVSPELSHNTIGLTEDDFMRLVTSAAHSLAAIGTFAHQIVIIQANNASAASEIKRLVSGSNGYDPQKWICVWPEVAIAVDAGEYVLIVASYERVADAAVAALKDAAGSTGEVITFWEHAG